MACWKSDISKITKSIGERVRLRRKALSLTQEQLAERAELSPTYIAKLEAGQKSPSLETLVSLAASLEIDLPDIVGSRKDNTEIERGRSLSFALSGLSENDASFVEQEMLRLVAYLRKRNDLQQ